MIASRQLRFVLPALCLLATACENRPATDVVWAVNVGGTDFVSLDGIAYLSDEGVEGGVVGWQEAVKGSHNAFIYKSYREGDITVSYPIDNGQYDLTLKFTEPREHQPGERVFDVFAEGQLIFDDLDVMSFRDGKIHSAFTVTSPNVAVVDGTLDIEFTASVGQPILNAIVVRRKDNTVKRGKLVWSDEFDYDGAPDPDRWNVDLWPAKKVNDENQTYTARSKNLRVKDGKLIIEAHKEQLGNAEYTSARIHSLGKGDIFYGRVEVRAKLPAGKGTWPAIWMLPSDPFRYATQCKTGDEWQGSPTCDAWPNSGEIDIMEHVGYQMNHVHSTVHNKAYYWINWEQRKGRIILDSVDQNFYTYALEWTPREIRAYVDDTLYFVYTNDNSGWESWPFDHPFHLVLNVAVGGWWGRAGGGIDQTIFPQRMEIDFVRVYALEDTPEL